MGLGSLVVTFEWIGGGGLQRTGLMRSSVMIFHDWIERSSPRLELDGHGWIGSVWCCLTLLCWSVRNGVQWLAVDVGEDQCFQLAVCSRGALGSALAMSLEWSPSSASELNDGCESSLSSFSWHVVFLVLLSLAVLNWKTSDKEYDHCLLAICSKNNTSCSCFMRQGSCISKLSGKYLESIYLRRSSVIDL